MPIPPQFNFRKMTKATFVCLYCTSSCHKTPKGSSESESWDIKLHDFGPNCAQIALVLKGNFFVNSLLLWCNPIIPYFKAFREWIMTHNCLGHKVVWFWPKLCPNCTIVLKEDFWGENDQYKLCQSIVSHHAKIFQNKRCGRSWDIRSNNLGHTGPKLSFC